MKAFAIAETNIRRLVRERANVFFVFILPMMLILLIGAAFGGGFTPTIGVVGGEEGALAERLTVAIDANEEIDTENHASEPDLVRAVERGRVQAGLVLPDGYDELVEGGGDATVRYYARPDEQAAQLRAAVQAAVTQESALLRAARFAAVERAVSFDDALATAGRIAPGVPAVTITAETAGEALFPEDAGRFDLGASSQLLLFVFLTSMTGSVVLIETRRLGLTRRMLSTPTPARSILLGETLGRFGIALVQGLIIMVGSLLFFQVSWGDPLGATVLVLLFCLVGAGAGMLLGATLSSDQQAGAFGLLLGLGLAALGGCMIPLEIFPPVMVTVAHFTPHAWGIDGFAELVRRDGNLVDILPEVGVLAAFAAVLLALATWRLRKTLTA